MTPGEPTPRGGDRLTARRRALELLHGADVGDTDPRDGLTGEDPYYARALVEGVVAHRAELDGVIRKERFLHDGSGRFVNGLLGRVARERRPSGP